MTTKTATKKNLPIPLILPSRRLINKVKVVLEEKPEKLETQESFLHPDTEEEIEFRQRKYPTISLGKKRSECIDGYYNNKIIIEHLKRLCEYIENQIRSSEKSEDRKKHGFRLSSIKKGINLIQEFPEEITSGRQARQIKGIGKGISDRIDEILRDENLAELEEEENAEDDNGNKNSSKIIAELTTVSGIGVVKARELMLKYSLVGVEDLIYRWSQGQIKVGRHELTHHIEVGLRWYHDTKLKIDRKEMDAYSVLLKEMASRIDKDLRIQICGSYRRGKSQSNDVDVLVTHPSLKSEADVTVSKIKYLPLLLDLLVKEGIIVDSMTDHVKSPTKYMGVSKVSLSSSTSTFLEASSNISSSTSISSNSSTTLFSKESIARRIDIRFVSYESWASALFYFTGSGTFNKLFRGIALQRGYTLNEYGIYRLTEKGERGELIPTFSEEQIFDVVGIEYLKPEEREY